MNWHKAIGFDGPRFHIILITHYADAAADIEFKFPFGFKELEGFTPEQISIGAPKIF